MTKKEKIELEYPLKGSAQMIWSYIGTPSGLSTWFADDIKVDGKIYSFTWSKVEERSATLIAQRNGVYVRFRWQDEEPSTFFEMRILFNEITRQHTLMVIDFASPDEVEDQIELWGSQIDTMRRHSGM